MKRRIKLLKKTKVIHTVIKAFVGLVILPAIAGKYIPAQIPAIARFSPALASNCPSFVFPAIAGIFPRSNLGIVPGSSWELSQLLMR